MSSLQRDEEDAQDSKCQIVGFSDGIHCMHADGFDQQLVEAEVQISSAPAVHVQGLAEVPVPTKMYKVAVRLCCRDANLTVH